MEEEIDIFYLLIEILLIIIDQEEEGFLIIKLIFPFFKDVNWVFIKYYYHFYLDCF